MIQELHELGFSEKEAQVYVQLLKMGQVTIGPITEKIGGHKQTIYNILMTLERKEVVMRDRIRNRQYFSAVDPAVLLEKHKQAERVLERIVPQLELISGQEKHISAIDTYAGIQALQAFHKQMLKKTSVGACIDVIGAGGDAFLDIMQRRYFFDRYENVRTYKHISHRLLMYENQREANPLYTHRKGVEVRYLPETLNGLPIATQIWEKSISILLFGTEPQIVHIKSEKIRSGFVAYFASLWAFGRQ